MPMHHLRQGCTRLAIALFLSLPVTLAPLHAQDQADETGPGTAQTLKNSVIQNRDAAWTLLRSSVAADRSNDLRMQALAALAALGNNPRSVKMITDTLTDKNIDVRTAAVLAAGLTRSTRVQPELRILLDDKEPEVAYAAASTLWKMGDHSGEDILIAVVDGERSDHATMLNGAMHDVSRQLHHPAALARMGAMQGASMFLGPFGWGITAFNYMHKNGGDSARLIAVEQVAQDHTKLVRTKLLAALTDKDLQVRVAAAKALSSYHGAEVSNALAGLFSDGKGPVRLTAASSYLISTSTTQDRALEGGDSRSPATIVRRPKH